MIDKLEVTLQPEIPLSTEVEAGLATAKKLRRPQLYENGFDLEPLGIPAILERRCCFGATQRLSVKGAGRMTLGEMAAVIGKVFDADPWESRLARVDLAVDLPGVPVDWVRSHIRVAHKRDCWEKVGTRDSQGMSIYIGHTADLFRFYDKVAEARYRNRVSFDETSQPYLTRIERQLRTGRIPKRMSTLSGLALNALDFNPFSPLRFAKGGKTELQMDDYAVRDYLAGLGLRGAINERGFARFYQDLNECSKGNAARTIARLKDFLPTDPESFCDRDIFALYRTSLTRQISESADNPLATAGQKSSLKEQRECRCEE